MLRRTVRHLHLDLVRWHHRRADHYLHLSHSGHCRRYGLGNTLPTFAPNFQGYMFAVCNFQFAHGFAFISDVGARNLAMGYLAIVIPDPGTVTRARLARASPNAPRAAEQAPTKQQRS